MDVGMMVGKITLYNKVLTLHSYVSNGSGKKPWSVRHSHLDGSAIDTRDSEWTYYAANGEEMSTGKTPDSLDVFLSGF